MPFGRMHDHAGRLIHHNNRIILVEQIEWNRLRLRAISWWWWQHKPHPLAYGESVRCLTNRPIDRGKSRINAAADACSADVVELVNKKSIEPNTDV